MFNDFDLKQALQNVVHMQDLFSCEENLVPTGLRCSCGGNLGKIYYNNNDIKCKLKEPRYSRRKRQMKKNLKKWQLRENSIFDCILFVKTVVKPIGSSAYKCLNCGKAYSFYAAMLANMFEYKKIKEGG